MLSAATAIVNAALTTFGDWNTVCELVAPSFKGTKIEDKRIQRLLGLSQLGWGVGKVAAILSGPAATTLYCKLASFSFAPVVWTAAESPDVDIALYGILWAGYIYFGHFQK